MSSFATTFTSRTGRGASSTAGRFVDHPMFERLARAGFVMAGLVHLLIGYIALRVAFGGGGRADQTGAMAELASKPGGGVALWVGAVAFLALGLWRLTESVLGRRSRREGKSGSSETFHRAKALGEAVVYAVLAFTAVSFARGSGSGGGQSQGITAKLLQSGGGAVVLALAGLAVIAVGGYYVHKGARQKFMDDLDGRVGNGVRWLGTAGYIAKGLALAGVGILVIVATTRSEPDKASGLDGALKTLGAQPYGQVLLVLAALGIATYGLYNLVRARHAKM